MPCNLCEKPLNLLPGPQQSDYIVIKLKKAKELGVKSGMYHKDCYIKLLEDKKLSSKVKGESEGLYKHYYEPILPWSAREAEGKGE